MGNYERFFNGEVPFSLICEDGGERRFVPYFLVAAWQFTANKLTGILFHPDAGIEPGKVTFWGFFDPTAGGEIGRCQPDGDEPFAE